MTTNTLIDYGALGKQRFDNFCHTVDQLISDQGNPIDLLAAGGNSGMALEASTELIYEAKGLSVPHTLRVPLYRYLPGHSDDDPACRLDTGSLLGMVNEQVASIHPVHNVLFVDDEIYHGYTALGTLDLINQSLAQHNQPKVERYTIVAEDQGFEVPQGYPEVRFVPYDYELEGLNNVIFFFTPSEFEDKIAKVLGDDSVFPFHCRTNILLGVPVKEFNNGHPRFTDKYLEIAQEKVPNLRQLQERYRTFLKGEIARCLSLEK